MPDRDGSGPRGSGRGNRRNGSFGTRGECRRNSNTGGNRSGNRSLDKSQSKNLGAPGTNEALTSIITALLGLATAAVPVILKLKNLLTVTNREKAALPEKSIPKEVIIEAKTLLSDTEEETGRIDRK